MNFKHKRKRYGVLIRVFMLIGCTGASVGWSQSASVLKWREQQDLAHVRDSVILMDIVSLYDDPSAEFPSVSGNVFSKRVVPLITLALQAPGRGKTDESLVEIGDTGVSLRIEATSFAQKKHKMGWEKQSGDSRPELYKIDGKPFFGTDGDVPHREFKAIVFKLGGKSVVVPRSAYADLYDPQLRTTEVYSSTDRSRIYIMMMNSDGAGSYGVTWVFRNGKYARRIVEYGW